MKKSNEILSDITVHNKYAKFIPELGRRETWKELVTRNMDMHIRKYPSIEQEIRDAYVYVYDKKVLPSMRSLQFGGLPIELANNRLYNCAFVPFDHVDAFSELMFLLLGGTGGGYSVQGVHVDKLPTVHGTLKESRRFLIGDSIEGWADSVKVLLEAYFYGKQYPEFDFRDIRPQGAPLSKTGGKAPGATPLRICLSKLAEILRGSEGRKLKPIEAHDMGCIIADAVLSGGIRRAALISLFDRYDEEMLTCKSGEWWNRHPHRGRANNSAVLPRGEVSLEEFNELMDRVESSGCGEPGVYWTNDIGWGTNPCCEISLRPCQFCNLTEVNASDVLGQEDLNNRAKAASLIGTLQAGYTDFHYLRPIWRETTEGEALVGIGMTGIGSGSVIGLDLNEASLNVVEENRRVAALIGINSAARTTTVKPSGTSSLVVGSSSGIHAWYGEYYIRRMRLGKDEALYQYLLDNMPELVEDDKFNASGAVASFPQKAPDGAILRTESMLDLLERVRVFNLDWVRGGHIIGDNTHNVSCTISVKEGEWGQLKGWMWEHKEDYNGISVLPYDGGTYVQAPFEECTKEEYERLEDYLRAIDLTQIREGEDNTNLSGEAACAGGLCEI